MSGRLIGLGANGIATAVSGKFSYLTFTPQPLRRPSVIQAVVRGARGRKVIVLIAPSSMINDHARCEGVLSA